MLRLALILHLFIGSTLAGSAMVVALAMGFDTMRPVLLSALIGFLISIPLTWFVAKQLYQEQ